MGRILEGVVIALRAIWGSKLRSFMTVLGNIVAVTSIIAVVSLIQGLNATVTDAIVSEVGADSFVVERFGITRSEEDFEKVRSNPRITMQDAEAIRRYSPLVRSVMAESEQFGPDVLPRTRCSRASRSGASRPSTSTSRPTTPSAAA